MLKYLLLSLSLLVTAVSLLTLLRAPDWMVAWKLAILADEYGHWLIVLPLALAVVAGMATTGGWRVVLVALGAVAVGCFLRPALSARRIAATLPQDLTAAFGPGGSDRAAFSWGRLYAGPTRVRAKMTTVVMGRPDGQDLPADIYEPAVRDAAGKPRACVVVIYGGGWDSGDRKQLPAWNDWMVARGYVVAAISYRLAPRWQWPAQRDDVLTSLAWLKAHAAEFGLDPQRFVLLGRSAGGQIAAAVGYGAHDPAIRGVVALYAPHDMPFVWSVSREDDVLDSLKLMRQYMGGGPEEGRQASYASASAQILARADSPPTLLMHGDLDTLAWVRHSERLSNRLQELNVPHYFLRLPWATHAFDFNLEGPGGQLESHALERFLAFATRSSVRS